MKKPNKPEKGTAVRLIKYISRSNPLALVLMFVFIIISAVAGVIGSIFVRTVIDDYIAPLLLEDAPVFTELLHAILVMACVYALGVVSNFIFVRMMVGVAQSTLKRVRDEMFSHMQTLPVSYYDSHSFGEMMSLYTNDADTLREFIAQSFPQLISSIITIIAVMISMLVLNLILSAFVFVFAIGMVFLSRVMGKKASKHFRHQQRVLGTLNGFIEETMNGQKVVKVFCHEDAANKDFQKRNLELRTTAVKANRIVNILMPVMMQIGNVLYVLIAIFGGFLAIKGIGDVTVGLIAAFLILARSFSAPLGQISSQVNIVVTALAGASRIFKFLDEPKENDEGTVTLVDAYYQGDKLFETSEKTGIWAWKIPNAEGGYTLSRVRGDVSFKNVDFGYIQDKIVLSDMNLDAKAGQKIAFVGATGAGKTTITNLINRFYDINAGTIIYDGIDIKDMKKADLRRSLGIVLQDTSLFTGTIAENIRYGNIFASDDDVVNAATLAGAHDFISRLPFGYDTVISGNGANLSGGQRQLLSIARAAIADPPVMILDEATSSIDTRTEVLVQKGMDGLMKGRTVFVIAHRLSTVINSDIIIVLEQGKIIESGSHKELIAKKGKYYQLYSGGLNDE